MIAPVFDRLANRFELVCALEPGQPAVAASDITDLLALTGRHSINVRFAVGHMDRLITSLEHGAAADQAWLLRHPDHAHDLLIEPSMPPGELGYLEHSRTLGSRYWVLGAATHATGFGVDAVHQRIDERMRELAADGWTASAIGSDVAGQNPHRPVRQERFLAVAAAEAVSAAIACHNGPGLPSGATFEPTSGEKFDPTRAYLTEWTAAWGLEQAGAPSGTALRLDAERQLAAREPGLMRDYHRRAAAWPVHEAMLDAVTARLSQADQDDDQPRRLLADRLTERVTQIWEATGDLFAAIGAWRADSDRRGREWTESYTGPVILDLAPKAPLMVANSDHAVTAITNELAARLVERVEPAVTTAGYGPGCERPWEHEPDRAPFTVDADGRQWTGEAVRLGDGTWAGYLDLPAGHPWHGHEPGHRDIDEVPIVSGVTSGEPHGPGWRLGFTCGGYRPATGWGDPVDYQDLSRVPRELAILAGHAALTAKAADAAPHADGQPSLRRAALAARPAEQKGRSRGRA